MEAQIGIIPGMEHNDSGSTGAEDLFRQLASAGERKRDQQAERLANAFIAGAERLAKQRDPFATFQKLLNAAAKVDAQNLDDAHRQFERYFDPTVGSEEASAGFDVLVGAQMFRLDPDKFLEALLGAILANLPKENKENIEFSDKPILRLKPIELRSEILPNKPFRYINFEKSFKHEIIDNKLIWQNESPLRSLLIPNFNEPFIVKPSKENETKDSGLSSFKLDPDYLNNLSKKTDSFINKTIKLKFDPKTGRWNLDNEEKK